MKRKLTILISLLVALTWKLQAQTPVPNGNFENWTDSVTAQSWNSNNYSLGGFLNYYFLHQSTDAHGGSYAAKIETISLPALGNMGGLATLGTYSLLSGLSGGLPISGKPIKLSGYFKYAPVSGDTMAIIVIMTEWNGSSRDTLFYNGVMANSTVPTYTQFDIPITYTPSTATPDTMNIIAISSAGYAPQIGSTLYIDDLTFTYDNPGYPEFSDNSLLSVFPNPTSGNLNLLLDGKDNVIKISDITGKVIIVQQTNMKSMNVDLSAYPNGMYFLEVESGQSKLFRKIIVAR